jgi:single-stranded-DNA-specific exonuclease
MFKEWRYKNTNESEKSLVKRLLAQRGITKPEEVKEFLSPLTMTLTHPDAFVDMPKCVERVAQAIEAGEKIVIHGDFDADGITSTALLHRTLTLLGADVGYFIPEREKEGHGFDTKAIVKLMTSVKPKLIISVDCGISDVEAIDFLNSFKIDVIITDHHEAPQTMPKAFGIINPKAPDALDEKLSAKEITNLSALAGVGVAFKLAQALLSRFNRTDFIPEILPYVAVGTVADVVPLIGENRYFVAKGLQLIRKHNGLQQLLEKAGYKAESGLTAENIAFGVSPRINAAGRMGTVDTAIKLLISDNPQEIKISIQSLDEFNNTRQTFGQEMFAEAEEMLKKEGNSNPAIILFNPKWHIGIIGITASKLVEKYYKPAFLMTYSEETQQMRCSARSIEDVNLYEVIAANSERLDGFGGHSMAAGFAFTTDKISFEEMKKGLNETIRQITTGQEIKPFINIDLDLSADEINEELVAEISKLEPFGAANQPPVFSLKNLTIKEKKLMGDNKDHLRLICRAGDREFTCVRWQQGDIALKAGDTLDIAFHPQINEFNGNTTVQLVIDDIHSENLKEDEPRGMKYYDHRKKTGIFAQVEDYVKNSPHNIRIFAESKTVLDSLKPFKALFERVFHRDNAMVCDTLMFFDYPAERAVFEKIISQTSPSALHFMNYDLVPFDEREFLKTVNGMLKFAHNNSGGKVELRRFASFLGKSYEVFDVLFQIFEETGLIKVLEKTPDFYRIEFIGGDLGKVLHSEKYAVVLDIIDECEHFRQSLLEDQVEVLLG